MVKDEDTTGTSCDGVRPKVSTIISRPGITQKLLWVGLAALAIRLLYLCLNPKPLVSDEMDYQNLASGLVSHLSYATDSVPTAYRPVGYPAFVSLIYFVTGIKPVAVKIVQAVLDSSIVFFLPTMVETQSEKARLLVGATWALFPPAILYPNTLMSETLFTVILVAAAWLFVHRSGLTGGRLLLGIVTGFLALIKPATIILLAGLIVADSVLTKSWRFALVAVAGFAIVVLPWTIRNWMVVGEPVIATNSGVNLLIGNNPDANGSYTSKVALREADPSMDEGSRDRFAFRQAVAFIASHPGTFFVNGVKKYAHIVSSESYLLVSQFGEGSPDGGVSLARRYAGVPLLAAILVNGTYAGILVVGWLGLVASSKSRLRSFVVSLLVTFLLTHLVTFGGSRFHFPLMPFFALFAVQGASHARVLFRGLSGPKKTLFLLVLSSFIVVWGVEAVIVFRA